METSGLDSSERDIVADIGGALPALSVAVALWSSPAEALVESSHPLSIWIRDKRRWLGPVPVDPARPVEAVLAAARRLAREVESPETAWDEVRRAIARVARFAFETRRIPARSGRAEQRVDGGGAQALGSRADADGAGLTSTGQCVHPGFSIRRECDRTGSIETC